MQKKHWQAEHEHHDTHHSDKQEKQNMILKVKVNTVDVIQKILRHRLNVHLASRRFSESQLSYLQKKLLRKHPLKIKEMSELISQIPEFI